jgi:hypothetical protein
MSGIFTQTERHRIETGTYEIEQLTQCGFIAFGYPAGELPFGRSTVRCRDLSAGRLRFSG